MGAPAREDNLRWAAPCKRFDDTEAGTLEPLDQDDLRFALRGESFGIDSERIGSSDDLQSGVDGCSCATCPKEESPSSEELEDWASSAGSGEDL